MSSTRARRAVERQLSLTIESAVAAARAAPPLRLPAAKPARKVAAKPARKTAGKGGR